MQCQLCSVNCAVSAVQCQLCNISCAMSDVLGHMCSASYAVSAVQVLAVQCQLCSVSCAVSAVQCQLCSVSCAVSAVQCQHKAGSGIVSRWPTLLIRNTTYCNQDESKPILCINKRRNVGSESMFNKLRISVFVNRRSSGTVQDTLLTQI